MNLSLCVKVKHCDVYTFAEANSSSQTIFLCSSTHSTRKRCKSKSVRSQNMSALLSLQITSKINVTSHFTHNVHHLNGFVQKELAIQQFEYLLSSGRPVLVLPLKVYMLTLQSTAGKIPMEDFFIKITFIDSELTIYKQLHSEKPSSCKDLFSTRISLANTHKSRCLNYSSISLNFPGDFYYLFIIVDEYLSWMDASQMCSDMGGYLPIITSREELETLLFVSKFNKFLPFSDVMFIGVDPKVKKTPKVFARTKC